MSEVIINEETFRVEPLTPFGYELTPESGDLNIDAWIMRDVVAVTEAVKAMLLMVIRKARRSSDRWRHIQSSRPDDLATIPHLDLSGQPSTLIWTLDGTGERKPTRFIPAKSIKRGMEENITMLLGQAKSLQLQLEVLGIPAIASDLNKLILQVEDNTLNPDSPGSLQREIYRNIQVGNLLNHNAGNTFLRRFFEMISPKSKQKRLSEEVLEEAREAVLSETYEMLGSFRKKVRDDLTAEVLEHSWMQKPDSAVLVRNRLISEDDLDSCVMHLGVPNASTTPHASLVRSMIVDYEHIQ